MLMRTKFTLLACLIFGNVFSQNVVDIIFVDLHASDNINRILKNEIDSIAENSKEFVIYISNSNDPVIIDKSSDIDGKLNNALNNLTTRAIKPLDDIKKINTLILSHGFLSNINLISPNKDLNKDLVFHFFFDKNEYEYGIKEDFIDRLLFTNRLLYANGSTHKDVSIKVYLTENKENTSINIINPF